MARLEGKAAWLFLQETEILCIAYGPDLPLGGFLGAELKNMRFIPVQSLNKFNNKTLRVLL